MTRARLLAFLLCDNATRDQNGKVTLHGVFDKIIAPQSPREARLFYVYYRVVVTEPCVLALNVTDPSGSRVTGSWRDTLTELGPAQAVWAVASTLLQKPGSYLLELIQEDGNSESFSLAQMRLTVEVAKD